MLITVQNNYWGISTDYQSQHGESEIADRARAFNIKSDVINGNDPVESFVKLKESFDYIRQTGKPAFVEARVSRLYGHSSASGANPVQDELDCVRDFEQKLLKQGVLKQAEVSKIWQEFESEARMGQEQARQEPAPHPDSIWDHVYYGNENADWRKF